MADDKLTLHVRVSHREARDLWLQLSKRFARKDLDEIPDNECPQCGRFKRGERVGPDKLLCFRCHRENSPSMFRRG